MVPTDICIAVCTRNRAEYLRAALESLAALQPCKDFQSHILLVDNASEDATNDVIRKAVADYPRIDIRSVYEADIGFGPARDRAVKEAESTWIAFFDDDQIAEPDWLIELWRCVERNDAVCVGGAVRLRFTDSDFVPGPFCRRLLSETPASTVERTYQHNFNPGTGNLLVRRSIVLESGGFAMDHQGRGEDARLFSRMRAKNYEAWFTPDAVVTHVIPSHRNQPAVYFKLAKECSQGGDLSWSRWTWRLPLISMLRLLSVLVIRLPKLCRSYLLGTEAQRLDQSCALRLAFYRSISEFRYSLRRLLQPKSCES